MTKEASVTKDELLPQCVRMLGDARCPVADCRGKVIRMVPYSNFFMEEPCEWCAERKKLLEALQS